MLRIPVVTLKTQHDTFKRKPKMMKIVLFVVALCAVFAHGLPAGSDGYEMADEQDRMFGNIPPLSFFIPEPVCSFKCGFKCFRMGLLGGYCYNSVCTCFGSFQDQDFGQGFGQGYGFRK